MKTFVFIATLSVAIGLTYLAYITPVLSKISYLTIFLYYLVSVVALILKISDYTKRRRIEREYKKIVDKLKPPVKITHLKPIEITNPCLEIPLDSPYGGPSLDAMNDYNWKVRMLLEAKSPKESIEKTTKEKLIDKF